MLVKHFEVRITETLSQVIYKAHHQPFYHVVLFDQVFHLPQPDPEEG